MKEQMKRSVWILVGIGAVLIVTVFFFAQDEQKKVTDFVITHKAELESIALNYLGGDETTVKYRGAEVDAVYAGEYPMVQFYYSGSGLAPSTTYYGFYYSSDDVPAAFQNVEVELTPTASDEWTWDDGTDNGGWTKRIAEHWFYYEAWF